MDTAELQQTVETPEQGEAPVVVNHSRSHEAIAPVSQEVRCPECGFGGQVKGSLIA